MKRNLRFYFALFFAKGTALVLKLIGRKGTSMPGSWAIILCPDFLGRMPRPQRVIGITGTNGKTTVANLVEDALAHCGYDFVCNRSGTNVATGVASSLIANSTFFGKPKKGPGGVRAGRAQLPPHPALLKARPDPVHQYLPGLLQAQRPTWSSSWTS